MGLYEEDILQDITEYATKAIATKIYEKGVRQRKGYPLVSMRTEGCEIISGIVYCRNRKTCAKLVDLLCQRGLSVSAWI